MTSIRKFAYATLLAVTSLNFAPCTASAQEPAHGKFTLTHDVLWGSAVVPTGEYEFSFDPESVSPVLTLNRIGGTRGGFILLVVATERGRTSEASRLVLTTSPEGSYVRAMELPESGVKLLFKAPHPGNKQMSKVGNSMVTSGQ